MSNSLLEYNMVFRKYTNILSGFAVIASLFLAFSSPIDAATLNVCPSGCTYSTIQAAISAAAEGDTVTVQNGTYSGFTISKRITVTAANFNQNDPSQNTVQINGSVMSTGGSSWAWDQGPVIRGFKIHGSDPVTMASSPMTVEYNYITGTGGDNVSFEGGGGIVRGNRIQDPADDNIDADHQSKNILIENNYLLNAHEEGIEMRQHPDSMAQRTTVTIRGNRIENSPSDGFQIMDYDNFSNRHYVVERNLFINSGKGGIAIMPSDITQETLEGAAMPEPLYIVNNTFVGNQGGIAGGANAVVVNNIFSGQTGFDLKNVNGNSVIKNNLFAVAPRMQGTNSANQSPFTGNPMLSSTYTLGDGSLAIDKGLANLTHTYQYDGSGGGSAQSYTDTVVNLTSGQYQGNAPDLGRYESGMTGSTPAPTPTSPPGGRVGDINGDNFVNIVDVGMLVDAYGILPVANPRADLNTDGAVDIVDVGLIIDNYGL
jgi:hypothetical protein